MASIFRISMLFVTITIVTAETCQFDYTVENAKIASEDYTKLLKGGAAPLEYELVNTQYAAVMTRNEQNMELQFCAADSMVLKTDAPDWTGNLYAKIPIALNNRPGIKIEKSSLNKGCAFRPKYGISSARKSSKQEVLHISDILIEIGLALFRNYLVLRATFSDSENKHAIQIKTPLFSNDEKTVFKSQTAVSPNVPILRQMLPLDSDSKSTAGRRNNNEHVFDVWWMEDVLKHALFKSTEKMDTKSTDLYISAPLVIQRQDMKKLLKLHPKFG